MAGGCAGRSAAPRIAGCPEVQVHLAAALGEAGPYEQAVELARAGLAGARKIGDYGIEPSALVTLGWIRYQMGRYRRAEAYFALARRGDAAAATASRQRAYELFTQVGSPEADSVGFR